MGRTTYKHFDNPFDSVLDGSLYNSYNYYRKKYPHKNRDDVLNRIIETRISRNYQPFDYLEKIEQQEEEEIPSVFDAPHGVIIYEDNNYIYYTDKVWSKDRFKIISTRYHPRFKTFKCGLRTEDNSRFAYTIGTIPTYITSKSSKK